MKNVLKYTRIYFPPLDKHDTEEGPKIKRK